MRRSLRFEWPTRLARHIRGPRNRVLGLSPYHRRLVVEPLEDRRLLSVAVPAGPLAGSQTWYAANGPYILSNGNVEVRGGVTLTIQAGVQVQGWGALLVSDNGTGGNLVAQGVTFTNEVYLYPGEGVPSLSGDTFSGGVDVAAALANSLATDTVPNTANVDIQNGNITSSVFFPLITGGSSYYVDYTGNGLNVRGGGTLTIASGNTISGYNLNVSDDGTGGNLVASGVTFSNKVYLYPGAIPSLSGDTFSGSVDVAAALANSLATDIVPNTANVDIQNGNVTSSVFFPLITGGSSYYIDYTSNGLNVRGGGTLTIASGNTISGYKLNVSDDGTGGNLVAQGVTFTNEVYLYPGEAAPSLSGDTFSGGVDVAAALANSLATDIVPNTANVDIQNGNVTSCVFFPLITGGSSYYIDYTSNGLNVRGGGTLTIASGNTISGYKLNVSDDGTGGNLVAQGVTFTNEVYLYPGEAAPSLSGDTFSGGVDVAAALANSLATDTVPNTANVDIQNGNVTSSVFFPLIAGGSSYYIDYTSNGLNVRGGGTLTIASGNTISGYKLNVSDDGSGGSLVAVGVTFADQITLGAGSTGTVAFDTFANAGYNYFDGQMGTTVTDDNFAASKAYARGNGGPINLEGNYWGTTNQTVIRQTKIYDHSNYSSLPVIDIASPLASAPVANPAPTINSVNPPQPQATDGYQNFTISGSNFDGSADVNLIDNGGVTHTLSGGASLA